MTYTDRVLLIVSDRALPRSLHTHVLLLEQFPGGAAAIYKSDWCCRVSLSLSLVYPRLAHCLLLAALSARPYHEALLPPKALNNRDSVASSSGDSIFSLSSDSRFPTGPPTQRGFVPYAYDPELEKDAPDDDDDNLHKAEYGRDRRAYWSWRGIANISVLLILILALLTLFVCYPMLDFYRNESRNLAITANTAVNASGQVPTSDIAS